MVQTGIGVHSLPNMAELQVQEGIEAKLHSWMSAHSLQNWRRHCCRRMCYHSTALLKSLISVASPTSNSEQSARIEEQAGRHLLLNMDELQVREGARTQVRP